MIAEAYRKMVSAGMSHDDIAEMLEIIERGFSQLVPVMDVSAERRRAKDRERKRAKKVEADGLKVMSVAVVVIVAVATVAFGPAEAEQRLYNRRKARIRARE